MALLPSSGLTTGGNVQQSPPGTYSILATTNTNQWVRSGPHNWTNNEAVVEVVAVPNPTSPADVQFDFEARHPSNTSSQVGFRIRAGLLYYLQNLTGPSPILWDPALHRWLRIRHSGTRIYWDTSADGAAWTNRYNAIANFTVNSSLLQFSARGTTDAGRAVVRNINTPPAPVAPEPTIQIDRQNGVTRITNTAAVPTLTAPANSGVVIVERKTGDFFAIHPITPHGAVALTAGPQNVSVVIPADNGTGVGVGTPQAGYVLELIESEDYLPTGAFTAEFNDTI